MTWLRRHPIACFLAVTYAVTWSAWLALASAHRLVGPGLAPLYLIGLVGPFTGALVATAIASGGAGVRRWLARFVRARVGLRWWLVALGVPLGVAAITWIGSMIIATFGIAHAMHRDFGAFTGFPVTSPLVLWVLLVVVNGFGEESGWRGFLLPALQRRWSPLTSSLVVAAAWAVWHVPAFLIVATYREMPPAMIPMFFVGLASASIVLTWLYNRAHHSVLLCAIFHATYNLFAGSVGAHGALAAVESTAVIVIAAFLVGREVPAHPQGPRLVAGAR